MGHFILLLLKGIGWILLAILLILVLFLCIVLFVPLRYEVEVSGKDKIESSKANVRFSFLLHLISGNAHYEQEKLRWNLRIGWKKLQSEEETTAEESTSTPKEQPRDIELPILEEKNEEMETPTTEEPTEEVESPLYEEPTKEHAVQEQPVIMESSASEKETQHSKTTEQQIPKSKAKEQSTSKKSKVQKEAKKKWEAFSSKLKSLARKKELIMNFLSSEVHQNALKKVGKELKRLLLRLKPKKFSGRVDFGFEDPYWTGKILAWASIFYPFYGESLEVNPHFEERVIDGQVAIQGKISLSMFLSCGVRLILNKNIRLTIKHGKKLKTVL